MGLPEHELRPHPPLPRPSPGGAAHVTGDPGVRFRSAFSWSVIGDICDRLKALKGALFCSTLLTHLQTRVCGFSSPETLQIRVST